MSPREVEVEQFIAIFGGPSIPPRDVLDAWMHGQQFVDVRLALLGSAGERESLVRAEATWYRRARRAPSTIPRDERLRMAADEALRFVSGRKGGH